MKFRSLNKRQRKLCSRNCQAEFFRRTYCGKGNSPYIQIRANGGRIFLHRFVWEQANGRKLREGEIVHHINGDKRDNRAENLEALSGRAAHLHVHNYHKKARVGGDYNFSEFGF